MIQYLGNADDLSHRSS